MRKADFQTPRFRVAVHEAGHAVCAAALDIRPTRLALYARGGGCCFYDQRDHDFAKLEDIGACLIAGDLSELHFFDERMGSSRSDEDEFWKLYLTEYARRAVIRKAQTLVAQHAERIWQVASLLAQRGEMSGTRLAKAIAGAGYTAFLNRPRLGTWEHY